MTLRIDCPVCLSLHVYEVPDNPSLVLPFFCTEKQVTFKSEEVDISFRDPLMKAYHSEKGNAKMIGDMEMIDFWDPH